MLKNIHKLAMRHSVAIERGEVSVQVFAALLQASLCIIIIYHCTLLLSYRSSVSVCGKPQINTTTRFSPKHHYFST